VTTDLEKILKALHDHDVDFIIIGGVAAVLHGSAYVTADLDVCYSRKRENLDKIAFALTPFNPLLRGAPKNLPFRFDAATLKSGLNFTLRTDLGDVDVLGEVMGLGDYKAALEFSEDMEVFGISYKVLNIEGLIKSKKAAGRPKDLILLPELEALLEMSRQPKISNRAICNAIKKKAVIQFKYANELRIVEPQCHGISTAGKEVMRGFQTGGRSRSRRSVAEKLFEISKITGLKETGETFSNPGPNYNPNDQAMIYVHCRLEEETRSA
jgi:predicted nucleotidyltransferase